MTVIKYQSAREHDTIVDSLVGCFGYKGPLWQFSVCTEQPPKDRKEERIDESKEEFEQPDPAPIVSTVGPCPIIIQTSRTPGTESYSAPSDILS